MGQYNKRMTCLVCLFLLLQPVFSLKVEAESNQSYINELIRAATEQQLATESAWLNLLHYKSHVFAGVYSQADDSAFFLAADGGVNSQAELNATLRAFFNKQDTQCRFPARLHWLNSKLNFRQHLPAVECDEFNEWKQKLAASSITLVFPSMYLNNPASMFGHTFLRLDQQNKPALLNYTLSYAARSDPDDSGIEYVYKGLAGGYVGVFAVQPYFETVQSYGDIEHRDIWEYSMNLTQAEVDQLVRHVWEIRNVHFDYYFLRENCSYRLLTLLDVARPGINITQKNNFPLYAAPVDTVRAVMDAGFIEQKKYRPNITSRIEQMYEQVSAPAANKVFQILDNENDSVKFDDFNEFEQAQILELAQEISEFKLQEADHLLVARSRLRTGEKTTFVYDQVSAEQGHATARWHLAYGEENRQSFVELGIRPVFHDLLDKPDGFVKGAAISVMDSRLRWFDEQQELQLELLNLFSLVSLAPVKQWVTPMSARLDITLKNQAVTTVNDAEVLHLEAGAGLSIEWRESIVYMLADVAVEYSGWYEKNHKAYLGAELGAVIPFVSSRMILRLQALNGVTGEDDARDSYQWGYQYDLDKNHALRIDYELIEYDQSENKSLDLKYLIYF